MAGWEVHPLPLERIGLAYACLSLRFGDQPVTSQQKLAVKMGWSDRKTRDTIEEIKNHVVKQQKDLERSALNVGRVVAMRAESMVSDIDDTRSEVSSSVAASSVAPRYAHSTVDSARRSAREWH